tara:strand:+ start:102 stop:3428 length:3327 start_codon:yes stop_codon:yes gene_type:complete
VGELGSEIAPDRSLYTDALKNIQSYIENTDSQRAKEIENQSFRFYGSLVVVLVSNGIYNYKSGEYWPTTALSGWIKDANDSTSIGRVFLKALQILNLDTFSYVQKSENSLKYVMPILLHGMVPFQCASDYWKLLHRSLGRTQPNTSDLRAYWRSYPSRFEQGIVKPVVRFLRHGSSLADDLLERSIDFAEYVNQVGKQEAIQLGVETLSKEFGIGEGLINSYFTEHQNTLRIERGPRVPEPYVFITPWDGQGPKLFLPATPKFDDGCWFLISSGGRTDRIPASSFSNKEISLPVSNKWKVKFESPERNSEFQFSGHGSQKVYFFDSQYPHKLLRDHDRIRSISIISLFLQGISINKVDQNNEQSVEIDVLEQFPDLGGNWNDYCIEKYDLEGTRKLQLKNPQQEASDEVIVQSEISRPLIKTTAVAGVSDLDGRQVFSALPIIQLNVPEEERRSWHFKIIAGEEVTRGTLSGCNWSSTNEFHILSQEQNWDLKELEIIIRGKLGSDLRAEFVIVPDVEFRLPDRLLSPHETYSAEFRAPFHKVNGFEGGTFLDFDAKESNIRLSIAELVTEKSLAFQASIPRIRWDVTDIGATALHDSNVIDITLEDLAKSNKILDLTLGRPEEVTLYLEAEGLTLHEKSIDIKNKAGHWAFHLYEFYDSAAAAGVQTLQLKLQTRDFDAHLINIYAKYEPFNLQTEVAYEGDFCFMDIEWNERLPFKNRELRIWSAHRYWDKPIIKGIIDGEPCRLTHSFNAKPGPYLLEIAINDGFEVPVHPLKSSEELKKLSRITLGTEIEKRNHLEQLDPSFDNELLELISANVTTDLQKNLHTITDGWNNFITLLEIEISLIWEEKGPIETNKVDLLGQLLTEKGNLERVIQNFAHSDNRLFNRRLLFLFLPEILNASLLENTDDLVVLWESFLPAAVTIENLKSPEDETFFRWENYTGYFEGGNDQEDKQESWEYKLETLEPYHLNLPNKQLHDLSDHFHDDKKLPLTQEGWVNILLNFLIKFNENADVKNKIRLWRSSYSTFNDYKIRNKSKVREQYLLQLDRDGRLMEKWPSIFQDVFACALALTDSNRAAAIALTKADSIHKDLVDWAVILAVFVWSKE